MRRCPDGTNTLITLGPQGVVFEVTPDGEEVWRFVNPVEQRKGRAPAVVRQGAQRSPSFRLQRGEVGVVRMHPRAERLRSLACARGTVISEPHPPSFV